MCHYCPLVPLIAVVFALFAAFPYVLRSQRADPSFYLRQFYSGDRGCNPGIYRAVRGQLQPHDRRRRLWPDRHLAAADVLDRQRAKHHLAQHAQPPQSLFLCRLLDDPDPRPAAGGASLAISSYLLSLRWASDLDGVIDNLLRLFPLILSWAAFWLLYSIVPTTQVRNRDAVIGALVAALLFEAGKKGVCPLYHHLSVLSANLWRDFGGADFVRLGVLDLVYRLAWR